MLGVSKRMAAFASAIVSSDTCAVLVGRRHLHNQGGLKKKSAVNSQHVKYVRNCVKTVFA